MMEKRIISGFFPLPEGAAQYPFEYVKNNQVLKLKETAKEVFIGLCNEDDFSLIESLNDFHGKKTVFFRIDSSDFSAYLCKKMSRMGSEKGDFTEGENERLLLDKLANDAPIVNLVNSIMIEGISRGASDIHIESFNKVVLVRYRIDGLLYTDSEIEKEMFPGVSSRIKIMANLNIMERRLPQDGRTSVFIGNESADLRVSIIPITGGESIVLRLFKRHSAPMSFNELGFDKNTQKALKKIYTVPHGLFLVTGPTGSGKTTTLNAVLREIQSDSLKIITIEDPVEYLIDGIDQIQTNDRIGLSFESILRRVLRQDPDIIMVGEIRDIQTAELAVRSALTGHLVLSTIHTNDAVSVINRLIDMGIKPYLLAAVLRGVIAQRLVRTVCPVCRAAGCSECNRSGFKGRTAIMEWFSSDEELELMISSGEKSSDIRTFLNGKSYYTLLENGLDKAAEGLTTIQEVEKAVL